MLHKPRMEFGYNPPCGDRGYELIRPREYLSDLHSALDVASQSFGSLWSSDHLNYSSEFRVECWTLLTWMAARYPGPMLGTVVMCNSFRNPSLLAKMSASLQHMSSGRLILGYGAGWYEEEYRSYGFDYPSAGIRIDMFKEGVEIIRRMWTDSPAIVAEQADWWNDVMRPTKELKHKLEVLENHCTEVGRNYDEIRKTLAPRFFIDRSNKKAKEMAGGKKSSGQVIAGDPSAVREQLDELVELGFDFVVATFPRFQELDDMKLFVNEVMPYFE